MKPWWQLAVVSLACLALAGCRTDPNIVLLERENRLLEDEVYRLRDRLGDVQRTMQSCQDAAPMASPFGAGAAALGTAESWPTPPAVAPSTSPAPVPANSAAPAAPGAPRVVNPSPMPGAAVPLVPPVLKSGEPMRGDELPDVLQRFKDTTQEPTTRAKPTASPRPSDRPDRREAPAAPTPGRAPVTPTGGHGPIDTPGAARSGARADGSKVTEVVVNRQLTGGYDDDGQAGDEGLRLVVEPRDAQGRWVEAAAPMSVVLLDPALQGESARVARWDLSADDTAAALVNAGQGRGIGLELPWPAAPPLHGKLHLFVRYTTPDGRRLQVEQEVHVQPADARQARWTSSQSTAPPSVADQQSNPAVAPQWQVASRSTVAAESAMPETTREPETPAEEPARAPQAQQAAISAETALQRPVWSPQRR